MARAPDDVLYQNFMVDIFDPENMRNLDLSRYSNLTGDEMNRQIERDVMLGDLDISKMMFDFKPDMVQDEYHRRSGRTVLYPINFDVVRMTNDLVGDVDKQTELFEDYGRPMRFKRLPLDEPNIPSPLPMIRSRELGGKQKRMRVPLKDNEVPVLSLDDIENVDDLNYDMFQKVSKDGRTIHYYDGDSHSIKREGIITRAEMEDEVTL